ncbi:MAG: EAL domain-containing response regulator [Pseudomonadota bacterium]|nr:EAL domain-containing response regulator [Pseudomonadota bacterium]
MPKIIKPLAFVLEDDTDFRELLIRTATSAGYIVESASSISDFNYLLTMAVPDLCVLDLSLPDGDSISIISALGQRRFEGHIILISGVDDKVLRTATAIGLTLNLHMLPPLKKPVDHGKLSHILKSLMPQRSMLSPEDIEDAIKNNELKVFYQPKIDIAENRIVGAEALIRWNHPVRGLLAPGDFHHLLDIHDSLFRISQFIITRAIADCADWHEQGHDLTVSINAPSSFIEEIGLVDIITEASRTHELVPRTIIVEVTEATAFRDDTAALLELTKLRIYGCGLSIDDFGTGYSSLLQLYRLPFSEIKIDRSFISELTESNEARSITTAILSMAEALELRVVAEGAETQAHIDQLKKMGCRIVQGYFYSQPLPLDAFLSFVNDWSKTANP